jgi:RNase P subunit RPR2
LGAFATLYPRDQVHFPFILIIRMPVVVGAVLMMAFETVLLVGNPQDSVSHAAHVGGAAGGVIFALLFRPRTAQRSAPATVDYARLESLTDDRGREFVARMRENRDVPELERAWFARLAPRLACPTCGKPLVPAGRARLRCEAGHEVRYEA